MTIDKSVKIFDEESSVKQSNNLVEARYKLTIAEQRIILAIASQLNKNGEKFESISFKARDLLSFCNLGDNNYTWLIKTLRRMRQYEVIIPYKDKNGKPKTRYTGWITSIDAHDDVHDGVVDIEIDQRLKEDMLNLKEAYFTVSVMNLIQMKREYSPRLYMLLKKAIKLSPYNVEIDFLVDRFQLPKSYREKFGHLRKKVLEPCLQEINEKTDIKVDHEFIKEGRAYKKIRFTITAKKEEKEKKSAPVAVPVPSEEQQKALAALGYYDIHPGKVKSGKIKLIQGFIDAGEVERVLKNISHVILVERPKKEQTAGAIINAIIEDREAAYREAREKEKEKVWKEKEQKDREYEERQNNKKEFDLDELPKEMQKLDFAKSLRLRKENKEQKEKPR
jgi:plasmid replication initiation protein